MSKPGLYAHLEEFDKTKEPDEDSYETNPKLIEFFEAVYDLDFWLDAAATAENTICPNWLNDALHQEWDCEGHDVWCNPPHSLNEEFVRRADLQHKKYNINICMLIPANTISTDYYKELIEDYQQVFVENHPVQPRPAFLKDGKKTKFGSRNAYQVIIWRRTHQ